MSKLPASSADGSRSVSINNSTIVSIDEYGGSRDEFQLKIDGRLNKKEGYTFKLPAGTSQVIGFNAVDVARGVFINSQNILEVSGDELLATGRGVYVSGTDVTGLQVRNTGLEFGRYVVKSVSDKSGMVSIVIDDDSLLHSVLTGSEIFEPFNASGAVLMFKMTGRALIQFELDGLGEVYDGGEVAIAIEEKINTIVGDNIVTVSYTDNRFVVKSLRPGAIEMSFIGTDDDDRVSIGMLNPVLELGGKDFSKMGVRVVNGDAVGMTGEVVSVSDNGFIFDPTADGNSNHVYSKITEGSIVSVVDSSQPATIDVFLYQ